MRYKLLGKTGLRVSELCLGTMTFGEEWGWGASKEESRRIFDAFADAGGNFVDTANLYTGGTSEKFVGDFLKGRRERFVLATKYTLNMAPDDPNGGGNHRKNLVQSLDASLKRLNTDYIDLYWVHAWDGMTPLEEMMRALDDVVRAGKVHYVGISDAPAWVVSRANTLAELKDWSPFAALQIQYNLADRSPERDLLPMAKALDLAVTPWGVLAGGVLSGKYKSPKDRPAGARYSKDEVWAESVVTEGSVRIAKAVIQVAKGAGRTASQVALAWVLPGTLATFYGVARLDAGKAAILLLAELVVGVVSAVVIGGEDLSLQEALGGMLILTAAVIEARTESAGYTA